MLIPIKTELTFYAPSFIEGRFRPIKSIYVQLIWFLNGFFSFQLVFDASGDGSACVGQPQVLLPNGRIWSIG